MKKGLIIIGLAVLAAFLFREGQREGVTILAGNAIKASGDHADRMDNVESSLPATTDTTKSKAAQVPEASAVPQMQARGTSGSQLVEQANHHEFERPSAGVLRSSSLTANTKWKIWTGVRAVLAKDFDDDVNDIVTRQSGFFIVKDAKMRADDGSFSASQPLVVFDERMGNLGIISGRVLLTLKAETTLPQIAKEYSLKISDRFDHMKLYFVTATASHFDLGKFVYVLKRDPRVENAELEIVSNNYVKN